MLKEEAINLLVNATYSDEWQGNEDLTTAYNMAIKALELEPCSNCIAFKRYAKQMGFEIEQESKITSKTIQNILDYLANNNSRWSELRWEDKDGKGFETEQGYFIEGLKGLRDYLKESEE